MMTATRRIRQRRFALAAAGFRDLGFESKRNGHRPALSVASTFPAHARPLRLTV